MDVVNPRGDSNLGPQHWDVNIGMARLGLFDRADS